MSADILWVEQDTREWGAAWERLRAVTGDTDFAADNGGEVWQYMGTVYGFGPMGEQHWQHEFRHRSHPRRGGARVYVSVPATAAFNREHDGPDLCECEHCIRLMSRITVQPYPARVAAE